MPLDLFVGYIEVFLVIFARIMGLFMSAPFYSGLAMTFRFKMAFAFFVSLLALPLIIGMGIIIPRSIPELGVNILVNFVIGSIVGFFIYFITTAFSMAAQVFSIQMGLGMNEVYDPLSDAQVPAIGNVLGIMIILLLIRVDGHFYLVQMIVDSFKDLNAITINGSGIVIKGLLAGMVVMFELAFRIALPIIGATVLLDVAMGIISRVAPQFNVMIMGFNIKLIAGFIVLFLILPSVMGLGINAIGTVIADAQRLIAMMSK